MMSAAKQLTPPPLVVVWQSLVVSGYRSFFYELQSIWQNDLYLVAPQHFIELGSQNRPCEPFTQNVTIPPERCFCLPSHNWHVQAVYFKGLTGILRNIKKKHRQAPIVLCVAEPYSVTALLCLLQAKLALNSGFQFYTYALQNINKRFSLPIRCIEKTLFKFSSAVLSLGPGQTEVLRSHSYKGKVFDFPLWFDSKIFSQKIPQDVAYNTLGRHTHLTAGALLKESPKPIIGFCGSMFEAKGVFDLLRLWRENSELRNKYQLYMAGLGNSLDAVLTQVKFLNEQLGASIIHFGGIEHHAMAAFYSVLDVLVVPSRTTQNWKEQFGRIIVEAQACGAVVIGSDSGEIPFVIDDPARVFPEQKIDQMFPCIERAHNLHQNTRDQIRRKNYLRFSDVELAKNFSKHLLTNLNSNER